jgi:CO/xanthine dehydrogenase Mo-binding subunit
MNEAPDVAVEIVHSEAQPTGVGEIAAVPVPAAMANALRA